MLSITFTVLGIIFFWLGMLLTFKNILTLFSDHNTNRSQLLEIEGTIKSLNVDLEKKQGEIKICDEKIRIIKDTANKHIQENELQIQELETEYASRIDRLETEKNTLVTKLRTIEEVDLSKQADSSNLLLQKDTEIEELRTQTKNALSELDAMRIAMKVAIEEESTQSTPETSLESEKKKNSTDDKNTGGNKRSVLKKVLGQKDTEIEKLKLRIDSSLSSLETTKIALKVANEQLRSFKTAAGIKTTPKNQRKDSTPMENIQAQEMPKVANVNTKDMSDVKVEETKKHQDTSKPSSLEDKVNAETEKPKPPKEKVDTETEKPKPSEEKVDAETEKPKPPEEKVDAETEKPKPPEEKVDAETEKPKPPEDKVDQTENNEPTKDDKSKDAPDSVATSKETEDKPVNGEKEMLSMLDEESKKAKDTHEDKSQK